MGVHDLADVTWIRTVFDLMSVAVVKKLVSASICRYTGATTGVRLMNAESILCGTQE